jgi:RNA polymerase sigma factor (sigma-70 family)
MPGTPSGAVLELSLLHAAESAVREAAWERLIARHSRLLLAVARSFGGDHDDTMERYAFMLEKCREHDFRRLRAFDPTGPAAFSTWLTVTARRLCVDHDRAQSGRRPSTPNTDSDNRRALRRALAGNASAGADIASIADDAAVSAETAAVRAERDASLRRAIATLPPRERLLLALRFEDNLSASRIAAVLHVPTPFHVYRQLNATLARLRAFLVQDGIDGLDDE